MHIHSLHLQGFTSHADTKIEFAPMTVVRGSNGSGKTSIVQALEYLFSGRSESTDDRGAGAKELIRKGQDKAIISADLRVDGGQRLLRCSLTEKSGRSVSASNDGQPSPDFVDWLASRREVLSCLINGHRFVEMEPARQKEMLAAIVLPATFAWPEEIKESAHRAGIAINWSLRPFDLIAEAHDAAYKERTLVNRDLRAWQEPQKPEGELPSVEDIRARLRQRQDERTKLVAEEGRRAEALAARHRSATKAQEAVRDLQAKLSSERQEMNRVSDKLLSDRGLKEHRTVAGHRDHIAKIDAEIAQLTREEAEQKERVQKIADLTQCPQCPTCAQAITPEILNAIYQPEQKKLGAMMTKLTRLHHDRKELGNPEESQRALDAHKAAEEGLRTVEYRIHELEKQLAEKEVAAVPEESQNASLQGQIAEIDAKIERGNAVLQEAVSAVEKQKAWVSAVERKKAIGERLGLLENLVEYFGPKGVQARLLDEHVGGFERAMNAVLARWGYAAHLQFDPYCFHLAIDSATPKGNGCAEHAFSLRTISASQRYRFACAFQVALACATGFRFAVIDGADILDSDARPKLYGALKEAQLEQVIVLQTDSRREVPKAEGTAFWMLGHSVVDGVPVTKAERL